MKGVGRIYQQTFLDTYSKVAFAKLYDRKTPITDADLFLVALALTAQDLFVPPADVLKSCRLPLCSNLYLCLPVGPGRRS
jgi:hypothetical protein